MMKRFILVLAFILCLLPAWAGGAIIHVSQSTGNDSTGNGSFATPYKTIAKGISVMNTSDDLYLLCGDTWNETLTLADSGTALDYIVVGAYYDNAGSAAYGVSGVKPTLDGNDTIPANNNLGIIYASGKSYFTIKDLKVIDSYGHLICLENSSYFNVQNNYLSGAALARCGVKAKASHDWLIENNEITDSGGSNGTDKPALILATIYAYDGIIRGNYIHDNGIGEGIGVYSNSHDVLVEKNVVSSSTAQVGIYFASAYNNTARFNLLYGTGSTFLMTGINNNTEGGQPDVTENNLVYSNLIAGCETGIKINCNTLATLRDISIYNNTIVDCNYNFKTDQTNGARFSNILIKNNISYQTAQGITAGGVHTSAFPTTVNIIWDYNLWSTQPTDADVRGTNDPAYAVPGIAQTSGWRALSYGDLDGSEFALQEGGAAINTGVELSASALGIITAGTDFTDTPITVGTASQYDYPTSSIMFDIGGMVYNYDEPIPDPPAGTCETAKESFTATDTFLAVGDIASRTWHAQAITTASEYTACMMKFKIKKVGNPVGDVWWEIYSNNAGVPGSIVANGATDKIDASTISTTAAVYTFNMTVDASLSTGTVYWLVMKADYSQDATNYIQWHQKVADNYAGGDGARWDGSTWTVYNPVRDFYFEMYGGTGDTTDPTVVAIGVWDGDSCEQNVTDTWAAETVTICMELSEDVIVTDANVVWTMTSGPVSGDTVTGSYLRKTVDGATPVLLMDFTIPAGARITHPQMSTATGGTIQDGAGNDLDFTGSAGDLDGTGTITIAAPGTFTAGTFVDDEEVEYQGTYSTMTALKAAFSILDGDHFTLGTVTEPPDLDLSGDDCIELAPCGITLTGDWAQDGAGLTMGDWWTISGAGNEISGAFTGGANNVIQRVEFK